MEEMQSELHRATGHFFYDKFKNLSKLSLEKRSFMVRVLKLLIENSYLGHEMHSMASNARMPEAVKQMLAELQLDRPAPGSQAPSASKRKAG